ncbi:hypothetical protein Tco_0846415 [Tanacetum coccineum]
MKASNCCWKSCIESPISCCSDTKLLWSRLMDLVTEFSLILSYKSVQILLLRSCSSSSLASLSFNDEEKFTEEAGIFSGRDVIGDDNNRSLG